jgi:hypothetical protein
MASIKLQGDTSGELTISAPAVAGTNTLTLPASTGTVLTDTAPKAGNILQVVIAEDSTILTLATSTYTDTGLSASITPTATSSKILVMWNVQCDHGSSNSGFGTKLLRDATAIYTSASTYAVYATTAGDRSMSSFNYIDSPSSVATITYKVQVASDAGFTININDANNQSQIVLMEIAG